MNEVMDWLMAGDPAVRWQTLRDLLDAPEAEWRAERQRTLTEGWGARLLALQDPPGSWGGGIYSPKWTSTTYTLLTLCSLGIPPEHAGARRGAALVVKEMLGESCTALFYQKLADCDRCVVGMLLQIAVYFGVTDGPDGAGESARIEAMVENLLAERMGDGAWNCRRSRRPQPHHSSFHTTFNVLEGLRTYLEHPTLTAPSAERVARRAAVLEAEQGALEFMLAHHLYQSHQTGAVIDAKFTMLSFPPRWHYDILRGLEYFARINAPRDPRLQEAVQLLCERRRSGADSGGRWPVQQKHAGRVFFDLEKTGAPSRMNTLRALRVLRWWEGEGEPA